MRILCFVLLGACGGIENDNMGLVYDADSLKFANDVNRLIELQAVEFKHPTWARDINSMPINVMSFDKYVLCAGKTGLGCTLAYADNIVVRTITGETLSDTSLPHELIHVFSYTTRGNVDVNHENIPMWEAGERAFANWEQEQVK